jgi:hypothetical protein
MEILNELNPKTSMEIPFRKTNMEIHKLLIRKIFMEIRLRKTNMEIHLEHILRTYMGIQSILLNNKSSHNSTFAIGGVSSSE